MNNGEPDCVSDSLRTRSNSQTDFRRFLRPENIITLFDWQEMIPALNKQQVLPFPWTNQTLDSPCPFERGRKVAETHAAVYIPQGINLFALWHYRMIQCQGRIPQVLIYCNAPFAHEDFMYAKTTTAEWKLIYLGLVPQSTKLCALDQQGLLLHYPEYRQQSVLAYTALHIMRWNKLTLYSNYDLYARCTEVIAQENWQRAYYPEHVCVGHYNQKGFEGIFVQRYNDYALFNWLGIGAERLPEIIF